MDPENKKLLIKNIWGLGEDRISKLPDSLLQHILSFLTTKEAFVTSVLSTRWRDLLYSIPKLNFEFWIDCFKDVPIETKKFMNFVDRMLLFRDMSSIQSFRLCCYEDCDESRINAWISTVVRRKVEEFILSLHNQEQPFVFPRCLFTCESLTKLELDLDCDIKLPTSFSFPKLRILRLSGMQFTDDYFLVQLISCCPELTELVVACYWWNMKKLLISAPTVKYLVIRCPEDVVDDGLRNCEVVIYAPILESLVYNGSIAKDYILPSMPLLYDVKLDLLYDEEWMWEGLSQGIAKLLSVLYNVKHLTVSAETIEALSHIGVNLPKLSYLIRLEVSSPWWLANNALLDLLKVMPNLESLIFAEGINLYTHEKNGELISNPVPEYLLSHLKSLEYRRFSGSKVELLAVHFFLRNARALKKMTIIPCEDLSESEMKTLEVANRILMFSRASTVKMTLKTLRANARGLESLQSNISSFSDNCYLALHTIPPEHLKLFDYLLGEYQFHYLLPNVFRKIE